MGEAAEPAPPAIATTIVKVIVVRAEPPRLSAATIAALAGMYAACVVASHYLEK